MPRSSFGITIAFAGFLSVATMAEDTDPIFTELESAKKSYAKAVEQAQGTLSAAIKEKVTTIAQTKNLEGAKVLQAQLESFEKERKLPTAPSLKQAVSDYQSAIKIASMTMEKAYAKAQDDLTFAVKLKQADEIKIELREFQRTNGGLAPKSDAAKSTTAAPKESEGEQNRHLWVQPAGYFIRGMGKDWLEKWDDGKKDPNLFYETQRTKEYVEIRHAHLPVTMRLFKDKAMVKDDGGAPNFRVLYMGKWQSLTK